MGRRSWSKQLLSPATSAAVRAACVGVLGVSTALAQTHGSGTTPPNVQEAARIFTEAKGLYREGEYREALEKVQKAMELDPSSEDLAYNQGVIYEKLLRLDDAIESYRLAISLTTDNTEKERLEAIIRRIEGAKREISAPSTSATESVSATASEVPPSPSSPHSSRRVDGWVLATGGLALGGVIVGSIFGGRALSIEPSHPTTSATMPVQPYELQQSRAHNNAVVADVAFGAALVTGAASLLLYLLRSGSSTASSGVSQSAPLGFPTSFEVTF